MQQTSSPLILTSALKATIFVIAALLLTSLTSPVALAKSPQRFKTTYISLIKNEDTVKSIGSFNLYLSKLSSEAINKGVPVNIVISYATPKKILFINSHAEFDKTEFRLSKHALSDTYLLENLTTYLNLQFPTIEDALREISSVQIKSLDAEKLTKDKIAIRIYLDLFQLPPQIRARAFFSGRWRHDSGWSVWSMSQ